MVSKFTPMASKMSRIKLVLCLFYFACLITFGLKLVTYELKLSWK